MSEVETALMLRMEASLAKFEKQMARARKAGRDTAVGLEQQFANSNKKMSQSAEQSAAAIGKEMDRLRAKYDPLFAASKRYETELDELNRAMKVGALSARQYENALERLNSDYVIATGQATKLTAAKQRLTTATRGTGGGIQNVAFQVGDFATQVGAGTSASVALGQQLPQLLGGFGALGAVLGAVVAIGVPLAAYFLKSSEEAKTLSDRLDDLESAVDAYSRAVASATIPTADLIEKYGTATEAAREFISALQEASQVNATEALSAAVAELAGRFEDLGEASSAMRFGPTALGLAAADLADKLDIAKEEALALAPAMQALADAEGPREVAVAAGDLLDALRATLGPYEDMNAAQRELYDGIINIGEEAAELTGKISEAAQVTGNLVTAAYEAAQGFAAAGPAVDTLLGKVSALAAAAWDYAGAMGRGPQVLEDLPDLSPFGGPGDFQYSTPSTFNPPKAPKKPGSRSGSSGGGGGSSASQPDIFAAGEKQLEQLQRKIEMMGMEADQVAALEAKYKLLDEAKERGLDLDSKQIATGETLREQIDRQSEAIGNLTREYEEAKERADFFADAQEEFKDGMLDAIVEGENLAGVLEDLAKSFAKAALEAALFGSGPLAGGADGGFLGSLFSGLLPSAKGNAFSNGAPVTAFANGGVVSSPTIFPMRGAKTGLMGEAGPEAIMPLTRMANGKLGVTSEAGGGQVDVRIFMEENGNFQAKVESIAGNVTARGLQQYESGAEGRLYSTLRVGRHRRLHKTWGG